MRDVSGWTLALCLAAGGAQAAMPGSVPATVLHVSATALTVKTAEGATMTLPVTAATHVGIVSRKAMADLQPGAFVGSAAMTGKDGALNAQEVHLLPQGMGEGHRQMGADPAHTMTNATITKVTKGVNGEALTLDYKGGEQVITVAPGTPVVSVQPGTLADVKPGAAVSLLEHDGADGKPVLSAIMIGKDGTRPPF